MRAPPGGEVDRAIQASRAIPVNQVRKVGEVGR